MEYIMKEIQVFSEPPHIEGEVVSINSESFDLSIHRIFEINYSRPELAQIYVNILQNFDSNRIKKTNELGSNGDFSEIFNHTKDLVELSRALFVLNMQIFSNSQVELIIDTSNRLIHSLKNILNYKFSSNHTERKHILMREMLDSREYFINNLTNIISYSSSVSMKTNSYNDRFVELFSKYDKSFELYKNISESISSRFNDQTTENDRLNQILRDSIADNQVNKESNGFGSLADKYNCYAKRWLISSAVIGVCTLIISLFFIFAYMIPSISPKISFEAVQLVTNKFIILGIFGYTLVVSVRNYRSQMHNSVVNRHREHALKSFQAFVEATSDSHVKGNILSQAAAAVFTPQDTGYVKNEELTGSRSLIEMTSKAISANR